VAKHLLEPGAVGAGRIDARVRELLDELGVGLDRSAWDTT